MTNAEAWTRFLLEYYDSTLDDAFLQSHVGEIWGAHYFDEYGHTMQLNKLRKLFGLPQHAAEVIPQKAKDDFRAFALQLKQSSPKEILRKRTINYAITENGFELPAWLHDVYPQMKAVYTVGEFTIFQLASQTP